MRTPLGPMHVADPPKSNQHSTFILTFDPSYKDPRGRFVYTTVSYSFK